MGDSLGLVPNAPLVVLAILVVACTPTQRVQTTSTTAEPTTTLPPPSTTMQASTSTSITIPPPSTTRGSTTTTSTTRTPDLPDPETESQVVPLRIESRVADVSTTEFVGAAMTILNDPRGWGRAGFAFVADDESPYLLVLAEGPEVDGLCLPLDTATKVSCQNGPVVALNADRWRSGVPHWDAGLDAYRGYLINHEVGHLLGQRHPTPRCPVPGRPAAVMEPQTGNLLGCRGNAWPREWEIAHAQQRPVVYAPPPDWGPDPVPPNLES